jgi:hypothetical protein
MKAFLTGLGIGVGLAIVLAPENGERVRGRVRELVSEWSDTVSKLLQGVKNRVAEEEHGFYVENTTNQEQRGETRDQSSHAAPQNDSRHLNGDLIKSISKGELLNVYGIGPVLADRIHVISQNTFEELERELGRRERRSA